MSKLVLVPSPIGNLEDITLRAIRILKEADFILAEDTRTSRILLSHYGIDNQLFSYHQHNEHRITSNLVDRIMSVEMVALLSDAGTPGISDPGYLLINACLAADIEVECLPGPSALIPAIVVSGLPSDKFVFEGFLPQKKGRNKRIQFLKEETRTIIFYESPFRLVKMLEQLGEVFGNERSAVVCRELSKMYEEIRRGSLHELAAYFKEKGVKGEIVVVVQGEAR